MRIAATALATIAILVFCAGEVSAVRSFKSFSSSSSSSSSYSSSSTSVNGVRQEDSSFKQTGFSKQLNEDGTFKEEKFDIEKRPDSNVVKVVIDKNNNGQ